MSTSLSSSGTNSYLMYTKEKCRKCGRTTTIKISNTKGNPGRLFYCCELHGFSEWCLPTRFNNECAWDIRNLRGATEVMDETDANNEAIQRDTIRYQLPLKTMILGNMIMVLFMFMLYFVFSFMFM